MDTKLPYWMHQLVEYLLGLVLLFESARLSKPLWPAVGGVAVVLLGALGDAPLSAFRTVPRPAHRIADAAVGAALAALALLAGPGGAGTVMLAAVGVALLVLAWRTDFRPKAPRVPLRDRLPDPHAVGRMAGRAAGRAVVSGRGRWRARK